MDDPQYSTPPRKRLKVDNQNMEANNEDTNFPGQLEMLSAERDQARREVQVGIVEYVSTDTLGFAGIFKKRYS